MFLLSDCEDNNGNMKSIQLHGEWLFVQRKEKSNRRQNDIGLNNVQKTSQVAKVVAIYSTDSIPLNVNDLVFKDRRNPRNYSQNLKQMPNKISYFIQ